MATVEVKNLYKIFGRGAQSTALPMVRQGAEKGEVLRKTGCTVGIDDASFRVAEGEVFVIMGLSGSGKSTVLRCLNRLIEPTAGQVIIDDMDVTRLPLGQLRELRRHRMSMVFQHFGLLPHRTVVDNVAYGLEVQGIDRDKRYEQAHQAIDMVGLSDYAGSRVQQLSGGMQQRVGLARALATDADILLMDEAFSALDPLIRNQMQDELLDLQHKMHKTIVFITHDLDEALKLGDHIAIMKDGRIVQIGSPEEILTHPADEYVRSFVENVDRSKVITAGTVMQKPSVVLRMRDGTGGAVRLMREHGRSTLFVVDEQRRLRGMVRIDDAVKQMKADRHDLSEIMIEDVCTTTEDKPLTELMTDAAETPVPIVVVDDERKLHGIVTRAAMLSAMGGEDATVSAEAGGAPETPGAAESGREVQDVG